MRLDVGIARTVASVASGRRWQQVAVTTLVVALVAGACTPQRPEHDLQVTNGWIMDLTIQVSAEPLDPQDRRTTLGVVRVGETKTFRNALPREDRYAIHARYDDNRLEFDTVCISAESLEQPGWSITVPGTPTYAPIDVPRGDQPGPDVERMCVC